MAAGRAIPNAARRPSAHSISFAAFSECKARNPRQLRCHLDPEGSDASADGSGGVFAGRGGGVLLGFFNFGADLLVMILASCPRNNKTHAISGQDISPVEKQSSFPERRGVDTPDCRRHILCFMLFLPPGPD